MTRVDTSPLEGLSFHCLDGCALCCLCDPMVEPDETDRFVDSGLENCLESDGEWSYIRRRGALGPCVLLERRRCTVYGMRPHFCQTFPVHMFAGWRLQAVPNLSCPGIRRDEGGRWGPILGRWDPLRLERAMEDAAEEYRVAGIDPASSVRVLEGVDAGSVARKKLECLDPERAFELAMDTFTLDWDMLPIFCSDDLEWRTVRATRTGMGIYGIDHDGKPRLMHRVKEKGITMLPPGPEASGVILDYIVGRGNLDYLKDHCLWLRAQGDRTDLEKLYIETLEDMIHELWWRACLHMAVTGAGTLNAGCARAAIAMYDMDILDIQTIGIWI